MTLRHARGQSSRVARASSPRGDDAPSGASRLAGAMRPGTRREMPATKALVGEGNPAPLTMGAAQMGKLRLIQAREGNKTKECAVCSNRKVKGRRMETYHYCDTYPRKRDRYPNECFAKYHIFKKVSPGIRLMD